MEKSIFNKLKGVIGVLLIILALGAIFYWETFGRESFLYKDVVVFTEDVYPNTIITSNIIAVAKREETSLISNPIVDPSQIIGLKSKQFIPRHSTLDARYFDKSELVLNEDEFIFQLPKEWIKAFPSSLRRGDTAYLYSVENESKLNVGYSNYNDIDSEDRSDLQNFENNKVRKEHLVISDTPLLKVTIAYVKDGANREVVTLNNVDRLDGSSSISSIEVIGTVEALNILKEEYLNGYQFIILYQ